MHGVPKATQLIATSVLALILAAVGVHAAGNPLCRATGDLPNPLKILYRLLHQNRYSLLNIRYFLYSFFFLLHSLVHQADLLIECPEIVNDADSKEASAH